MTHGQKAIQTTWPSFFHRDMVAITATDRNRLDGGAICIAGWKAFANAARIHRWEEIDPVIHVYGNSAVVAYNFDMSFDMCGQTINMGGRDMFFSSKKMAGGGLLQTSSPHTQPNPAAKHDCVKARSPIFLRYTFSERN